nr:hypothetical protein [uncultured Pseudomonas sp.]
MLNAKLREISNSCESFIISENISRFHAEIIQPEKMETAYEQIFYELERVPPRDNFELTLELDGNSQTITSFNTQSLKAIKQHYQDNGDEYESGTISLKISKNLEHQKLSIYDLASFSDYLSEHSFTKNLEAIATKFEESISFVVFEMIEDFGSKTIVFKSHYKESISTDTTARKKKIALFKENTISHRLPTKFIPEDFELTSSTSATPAIEGFFRTANLVFSLAYISNTAEILDCERVKFKFNGYKTFTTAAIKAESLEEDAEVAFKIYSWIYDGGNCSDKLGLARNILTLNTIDEKINLTASTWQTIQSNYEIYLKENINQYLSIKRDLLESINDFCKKSLDIVDSFANSFQTNTIAFITFIITVVAVNGLKDSGTEQIFSIEYLIISILICLTSLAWLAISIRDTRSRLDYFTGQISSSTESAYRNIINQDELSRTLTPAIDATKAHANGRIKKFTFLWLFSALLFLVAFTAGYIINSADNKAATTDKEIIKEQHKVPAKETDLETLKPAT